MLWLALQRNESREGQAGRSKVASPPRPALRLLTARNIARAGFFDLLEAEDSLYYGSAEPAGCRLAR